MSKINQKEFDKLVKEYTEIYESAEPNTLDHALKANDVALLEKVASLITKDTVAKETPAKKTETKTKEASKDEIKESTKEDKKESK